MIIVILIILLFVYLVYCYYQSIGLTPYHFKGGDSITDYINNFLTENYETAYDRIWKVTQIYLYLRYRLNNIGLKLTNIRKYIWTNILNKPITYGFSYINPEDISKNYIDNLNHKTMSRRFEAIFYQLAGETIDRKNIKFFPLPEDFTTLLDKEWEQLNYYYNMFLHWNEKEYTIMKEKLNDKTINNNLTVIFNDHGFNKYTNGSLTIDKIRNISNTIFKDTLLECNHAKELIYQSPIKGGLNIQDNKVTYYIKNYDMLEDKYKKYIIKLSVNWLQNKHEKISFYPNYFINKWKVNTKLTKNVNKIQTILAMLTITHLPVFTNTSFVKENDGSFIFNLRKSPGLMTSSIPKANKEIRELEWVKSDKKYDVPFYIETPPNMMIETFASPLNHNAEVFCSLFPTDRYINGCIGKFDTTLPNRLEYYNWIPKAFFHNPPYTDVAMRMSFSIGDELHKKFPNVSVTTVSRRDSGLLTPIVLPYSDQEFHADDTGIGKRFVESMLNSPYLTNFIIVPEELFIYEDLFTGKEMLTASRKGAIPTDTVILIKDSTDDKNKLKDIQKIIFKHIVKTKTDKFYINDSIKETVVSEVMRRAKINDVNISRQQVFDMIRDINDAIS